MSNLTAIGVIFMLVRSMLPLGSDDITVELYPLSVEVPKSRCGSSTTAMNVQLEV